MTEHVNNISTSYHFFIKKQTVLMILNSMELHKNAHKKIRIGQINILNNPTGEKERYTLLQEHITTKNIEIITVQEILNIQLLKNKMSEIGLKYSAIATQTEHDYVAIFSKYPITATNSINLVKHSRDAAFSEIQTPQGILRVVSTHFIWGNNNEEQSLNSAMILNKIAQEYSKDNIPFIIGGDFNSDDTSRTMRYLHGKDLDINNESTFWTDPYEIFGNKNNWETTDQGFNNWGIETATKHNILIPELLPKSRIDYLLSYGWTYGKIGSPLSYERFGQPQTGTTHLSDHYGILTDILLGL